MKYFTRLNFKYPGAFLLCFLLCLQLLINTCKGLDPSPPLSAIPQSIEQAFMQLSVAHLPSIEMNGAAKDDVLDFIELLITGGYTPSGKGYILRVERPIKEPEYPSTQRVYINAENMSFIDVIDSLCKQLDLRWGIRPNGNLVIIGVAEKVQFGPVYFWKGHPDLAPD